MSGISKILNLSLVQIALLLPRFFTDLATIALSIRIRMQAIFLSKKAVFPVSINTGIGKGSMSEPVLLFLPSLQLWQYVEAHIRVILP